MKNLLFILFLLPVGALAQTTITTAQIRDAAVTYVKVQQLPGLTMFGRSANTTGAGGSITAGLDGHVLRRSGTTLAFGALDLSSANSTTGTLSFAKISSGTLASAITMNGNNTLLTFTNFSGYTVESTNAHLNIATDLNLDVDGDVKINNVSGTSGEFIGNVDGHLVWAVPPGGGGGSSSSAVLDVETTQVGNVGVGEDVLYTYTLPADTLDTNGEFIRGRISGIFALNDNDKTIRLKFGGTTIATRLAINTPSIGQGYLLDWEVIRIGATTQKCNAVFSGIDGIAAAFYTATGETLSGTVDIVLTGEATSDDDILMHSSVVTWGFGGGGGAGGGGDLAIANLVASETPSGTVNGSNVTFTLANTPVAFIHIYLDGLLQVAGGGNDYTISGTTITFVAAPLTGSRVRVSYIK